MSVRSTAPFALRQSFECGRHRKRASIANKHGKVGERAHFKRVVQ